MTGQNPVLSCGVLQKYNGGKTSSVTLRVASLFPPIAFFAIHPQSIDMFYPAATRGRDGQNPVLSCGILQKYKVGKTSSVTLRVASLFPPIAFFAIYRQSIDMFYPAATRVFAARNPLFNACCLLKIEVFLPVKLVIKELLMYIH